MKEKINRSAIQWNAQGQPISKYFDDVYFSTEHGLNESRYVFLSHNNLPERWLKSSPEYQQDFTIFETGFGSGLNFLATWQTWLNCEKQRKYQRLHFISVEKYPLSLDELQKVSALWPELKSLADQLIAQYPPQPATGLHRLSFDNSTVKLTLYFGDVNKGLDELYPTELSSKNLTLTNGNVRDTQDQNCHKKSISFGESLPSIDAWYLDGFTPAKNPDMWTEDLFQHMAALSKQSECCTFSTFTSASHVRKGLIKVGFCCKKTEGFGLKREMLFGFFKNREGIIKEQTAEIIETRNKNYKKNEQLTWLSQEKKTTQVKKNKNTHNYYDVTVIGGGISGCHSAFALANRGLRVILIEKNNELSTHASGNAQGLVYTRLSPHNDALSEFNLRAQIYSDSFYRQHNLYTNCGSASGVFHCAHREKLERYYQALSHRYAQDSNQKNAANHKKNRPFARWVDKKHTKEVCGIPLAFGGLFLEKSGWIKPPALCKALCNHQNITVLNNTEVNRIEKYNSADPRASNTESKKNKDFDWQCFDSNDQVIVSSKYVIIANAIDAKNIEQTTHLPIKSIRGQVSYLPANHNSKSLRVSVCGEGYIAPALSSESGEEFHSLGASFNLFDDSLDMNQSDQDDNFEKLFRIVPSLNLGTNNLGENHNGGKKLRGRVSFRTTSPDYFPIVGPVPNSENTLATFSALRKNAKATINQPGQYYSGLYCNLAMGSRGLAYAPLCSELLADLIAGDFLPVEKSLYKHLNPSRFLIRSLQRSK